MERSCHHQQRGAFFRYPGICVGQHKGSIFAIQIGDCAYGWNPKFYRGKPAFIHIEINTPFQRLRVKFGRLKFAIDPKKEPGHSVRPGW